MQEQGFRITAASGLCDTMKRGREPTVELFGAPPIRDWPGVSAAMGANDAVMVEVDVEELAPRAGIFAPRLMADLL